MNQITLQEKKRMLQELLDRRHTQSLQGSASSDYRRYTYDMFLNSVGAEPAEAQRFSKWIGDATRDGIYAFESARLGSQKTTVRLRRETGEELDVVNFSSYNYLGYSYHPEVIAAAKEALDHYGLGAASSPIISGTLGIHKQLEEKLAAFFRLQDRAVSLFSSGYGVNLGTISAFVKPGGYVVLDRSAHMSLLEGAQLSRANIRYFRHNDAGHLDELLRGIADGKTRILICMEGVYSADGDFGNLRDIVGVAKKYGAYTLVDEAHSMLLAGAHGRGACEAHGVLDLVDLIVITFSKSFAGVGGALVARKEIVQYVNWYARCRMFSCALDPAVTAGMTKVLGLVQNPDGAARRKRLIGNAAYMRELLKERVNIGTSESWIVTVYYGDERMTLPLNDFMQREGLDTSIMQFPAVPKNESRIRIFVTSEHTMEQIDRAVSIIFKAADKFGFIKGAR
jgi:7-keto-8-aminopelargonate synthetase-like enzyme